jgi:hypothetical protein
MTGLDSHKPDCACPPCRDHRAKVQRDAAGAEAVATSQAVARALLRLLARGSLSGPDALRSLVGHDDALRILRAAGMNAGAVAEGWQADQAAPRQATTQLNGGYAGDPDHDERVTEVLRHGTDAELALVRREVADEYARQALAAGARRREYYGHDRPMAIGVSQGPDGAPLQASTVHTSIPELGTEA